jgi:hypothetical protein
LGPRKFSIHPLLATSGSQWFHWAVRIEGLTKGETGILELHWPAVFRKEDLIDPSAEDIERLTTQETFASVLPEQIRITSDGVHWQQPVSVTRIGPDELRIEVVGTGRPFEISSQYYYTDAHLNDLLATASGANADCQIHQLSTTESGRTIPVVSFPSTQTRRSLYFQAYQHVTEYSGPWVLDALVRQLITTDAGRELRSKFSIHVAPVVDIDGLVDGLLWHSACQRRSGDLRQKNINRDWVDQSYAEVRAIRGYLEERVAEGALFTSILDLHNGWSSSRSSGACYTRLPRSVGGTKMSATQTQFIDHMTDLTDHCPTGAHYWEHDAPGTFAETAWRLTGCQLSHTVEFSRFQVWNRSNATWQQYDFEWHACFARDWIHAFLRLPETFLIP